MVANSIIESSVNYTSIAIKEDSGTELALKDTMRAKLRLDISPLSSTCCIFKVPPLLRRHKPEAYGPDIVSIGPFHDRKADKFHTMEKVKQWYLNNLLSNNTNTSLEKLIEAISKLEKSARGFYAEPLDHLNHDDFIEIMVLDGCFLIQLFRMFDDHSLRNIDDPIFSMDCMHQYLFHDLLLLENQLPWFVLECLYGLTMETSESSDPLSVLVLTAFTTHPPLAHNSYSYLNYLIGKRKWSADKISKTEENDDNFGMLHILDLVRTSIVFPLKDPFEESSGESEMQLKHTVSALSEAGVKFKKGSSTKSIMEIEFNYGLFTIPPLEIGELTDALFRNLIAFEQCYHGRSHKITSYAVLMDNLIGSSKDIEFLSEKEIVGNWLSAEDGSKFFNRLYNDTVLKKFYYVALCKEVNTFYRREWSKWIEILKREYLSNPWKVTSLIAACILLILTLLQTLYTINP